MRLAHTHSDGFTRILVTTFLFLLSPPIPIPNVHDEVPYTNTSLVHDQGPVALLQVDLATFKSGPSSHRDN